MKRKILLAGLLLQSMSLFAAEKIILDTDMSADSDDVGALAVLHYYADMGDADILGVVVNGRNNQNRAAACIDAINTYYGRPNIPIGTQKAGHATNSQYTVQISNEFPHNTRTSGNQGTGSSGVKSDTAMPDAIDIYRDILNSAANNSVTIVSVGFLGNLRDLIAATADRNLVNAKVKRLVVMGGEYPAGIEFNFKLDKSATKAVVDNWPTPITYTGKEIGIEIITGTALQHTYGGPTRRAYQLWTGAAGNALNDGRMSWDQTAVMIGVKGIQNNWTTVSGNNTFNVSTGRNTFNAGSGNEKYVVKKRAVNLIERDINRYMVGWVHFKNKKTNKCMTRVAGGSNVNQSTCSNNNSQRFGLYLVDDTNSFFQVKGRTSTGKCIDVSSTGGVFNNGQNIQNITCNGYDRQKWDPVASGSWQRVKNKKTSKCIEVKGGSGLLNNGQNIEQRQCGGNYDRDLWRLVRIN